MRRRGDEVMLFILLAPSPQGHIGMAVPQLQVTAPLSSLPKILSFQALVVLQSCPCRHRCHDHSAVHPLAWLKVSFWLCLPNPLPTLAELVIFYPHSPILSFWGAVYHKHKDSEIYNRHTLLTSSVLGTSDSCPGH